MAIPGWCAPAIAGAAVLETDVADSKAAEKMVANGATDKVRQEYVDGVTSASQLRAKRSHAASKQNENKITIFLGLMVMAIIAFFASSFKGKQ